jgi:hypothetical protein
MLTPTVTCRVIGTCHPTKRTERRYVRTGPARTTPEEPRR